MRDIWKDPLPAGFAFEGSYWESVDHLLHVFPPDVAADAARESLHEDRTLTQLDAADLAAAAQARGVAGAVHVRVARTAIERSNGRDYLTFTLIPKLEPLYLADKLSILVEELRLADGSILEPEKKTRTIKRSTAYRPTLVYQPGRDFTWAIPLGDPLEAGATLEIGTLVEVTARRMRWVERDLPEPVTHSSLTENIALEVEVNNPEVKIKIIGTGNPRLDFGQFSRNGRSLQFEFLDDAGQVVEAGLRRGSASGTTGNWHCEYTCHIGDARPAAVRVLVPDEPMIKQLPLVIEGVRLPGFK